MLQRVFCCVSGEVIVSQGLKDDKRYGSVKMLTAPSFIVQKTLFPRRRTIYVLGEFSAVIITVFARSDSLKPTVFFCVCYGFRLVSDIQREGHCEHRSLIKNQL